MNNIIDIYNAMEVQLNGIKDTIESKKEGKVTYQMSKTIRANCQKIKKLAQDLRIICMDEFKKAKGEKAITPEVTI